MTELTHVRLVGLEEDSLVSLGTDLLLKQELPFAPIDSVCLQPKELAAEREKGSDHFIVAVLAAGELFAKPDDEDDALSGQDEGLPDLILPERKKQIGYDAMVLFMPAMDWTAPNAKLAVEDRGHWRLQPQVIANKMTELMQHTVPVVFVERPQDAIPWLSRMNAANADRLHLIPIGSLPQLGEILAGVLCPIQS